MAGRRTAAGRISRAGAIDKGALGTRLAQARALLGADDRTRLEMLVTVSPAKLAEHGLLSLEALDRTMSHDEAAHRERETLFAKAATAENAAQRRDPVGRAWHEGLLSGHGVDAAALRDLGRQYGFLYWHEYRSVDATIGGYSDMVAMGSVRLAGGIGKDGLGVLWKAFSAIVDPMGHEVREALHKLCVDDMWFAEGPDWLDRCINTARAGRNGGIRAVSGALARKSDEARLRLAVTALVALARGGAREKPTKIHPFSAGPDEILPSAAVDTGAPPPPLKDVDPRFLDENGFMKPWADIAAILRGETDEEAAAA
jgi:hypothetical protein